MELDELYSKEYIFRPSSVYNSLRCDLIPFKVTILICHDCLVNSKCNSNNEISTDLGILNIRTKCVVQIRKRSNNENVSWFQIPKH